MVIHQDGHTTGFPPEVPQRLRTIALNCDSVATMIRTLQVELGAADFGTLYLLKAFKDAFKLTLLQLAPIQIWLNSERTPDDDRRLDSFVLPKIQAQRSEWEKLPRG